MALRRRCDHHYCWEVIVILSMRKFKRAKTSLTEFSSDTVAPTLVFVFYELALHCNHQEKLFEEVKAVDVHDPAALRSLPHLNGIINESLRIHPPVPTGGYRQSPRGGMTIGGRYIPGNTTIVAPRYTLGKRESILLRYCVCF